MRAALLAVAACACATATPRPDGLRFAPGRSLPDGAPVAVSASTEDADPEAARSLAKLVETLLPRSRVTIAKPGEPAFHLHAHLFDFKAPPSETTVKVMMAAQVVALVLAIAARGPVSSLPMPSGRCQLWLHVADPDGAPVADRFVQADSLERCAASVSGLVAHAEDEPPEPPIEPLEPGEAAAPTEGRPVLRIAAPRGTLEAESVAHVSGPELSRALRTELIATGAFGAVWTEGLGGKAHLVLDVEVIDELMKGDRVGALIARYRALDAASGDAVAEETVLSSGGRDSEALFANAREAAAKLARAIDGRAAAVSPSASSARAP
jgi:hypothetical protein